MIGFFNLRPEEKTYFQAEFGSDHFYTKESVAGVPDCPREDIETLCVFVNSSVDADVIDSFANLDHITTRSTGVDHIDVQHAQENGIAVSNIPGYGAETVAEFTFALMLSLSRNVYPAYHRVRESGKFSFDGLRGFDLHGKTLGVIGTGKIGAHVIQIANGFSMTVKAFDANPDKDLEEKHDFSYVESLHDLLAASHVVSLHVPGTDETRHMIDAAALNTMRSDALLINTARGEVVDTSALVTALQENQIAGAGLDVLEGEGKLQEEVELVIRNESADSMQTLLEDHALVDMDNVIVTPHMAFYTKEAEQEILSIATENISSFHSSGEPTHSCR